MHISRFQRNSSRNSKNSARLILAAAVGLLGSSIVQAASSDWVGGTSTDWNDASNWSGGVFPSGGFPDGVLSVNINTGNIATITANQSFVPSDFNLGVGAGTNGQINHLAGTAGTGPGAWMFIGCNTGTGLYNLADTTSTGGTYTGFGQGSGSLGVGGNLYVGGRGWDTGGTGTLNMNTTGTLTANFIALGEGQNGTGTGNFNLDNGTVNISGEFWVSGWSTGNMNQSGGTVNIGSWLPIGRTGTGIYNITGGAINAGLTDTASNITIGSFGGANGTLNASGGTITTPRAIFVGEGGNGTINVSGTAVISIGNTTNGLRLGANGGLGEVNLNGGTIETPIITQGTGAGAFGFNGGILKATASSPTYMTGLTAAYVRDGGAKIDTNGNNITIAQALGHSPLGGDAAIDGGLTKSGAGSLTISGSNGYTGPTVINAGTLHVSGTGDVNTSPSITVNGAGAKFAVTSSTAVSPIVTVTSGGVDGSGSIGTVNIASSASNFVANGNGGTGTLTIGTLDFAGNGNFNLNVASTSPVVATTTLNASGAANSIQVNAANALWTAGTYNLISYSSLTGTGFSAFQKGTITGLSNRQSATLTNPAGFIALTIAGDNPRWSGSLSSVWSTATMANPKNWALITSGTPTDYIEGDYVLFDDSATNTTPTLSVANVSPTSVVFNHSSNNYTLGGAFGIAGASTLTKQGTGTLTINNANTYTGATSLNAGQLNLNNASSIGTGTLVVASGTTIDNTSGSAVSLSTANPQTWNGDFSFGGSYALNMGTGAITRTTATTVTVNGTAPVTLSGAIGGGGNALNKAGSGTLVIAGTSNTYSGVTNVNAGTLSISGSLTTSTNTNINSGGTLNVAAGGTHTSTTTVYNGNVSVSGTMNTNGDFWVGWQNGGLGDLQVKNGGVVNGDVILIGSGNNPSNVANGTATVDSGGTINTTRWFVVGHSGAAGTTGTATINGTLNVRTSGTQGTIEVGTWDNIVSTLNINSGATVRLENNADIILGSLSHQGTSTVNQNGGSVTFYSDSGTTVGGTGRLILGGTVGWGQATGTYDYNLNGGTLTVPSIAKTSTATPNNNFNFNGGTLVAAGNSANFISGLANAQVRNGGAIIDTNGNSVTVAQPIVHSTIGGDNAIDGGLTKTGAGTLTLTGAATYTGPTTANAGKLVTTSPIQNNAPMTAATGGVIDVPVNGTATGVTRVSSVTASTGKIDLHDNDLVVEYGAGPSSYTSIFNQVKSGLALLGGTDANADLIGDAGIGSTEVDLQTISGTVLAVVDDGDPNIGGGITSISGYTIPNPTQSVLVKYTWFGDANLDGVVDGSDYALTDTGFTSGGSLTGWVFGDMNFDGVVTGEDYALVDTGFIAQTGALPEPTTLGLLGLGAMGMLRRRRKA